LGSSTVSMADQRIAIRVAGVPIGASFTAIVGAGPAGMDGSGSVVLPFVAAVTRPAHQAPDAPRLSAVLRGGRVLSRSAGGRLTGEAPPPPGVERHRPRRGRAGWSYRIASTGTSSGTSSPAA
jgi:hypothetical protein